MHLLFALLSFSLKAPFILLIKEYHKTSVFASIFLYIFTYFPILIKYFLNLLIIFSQSIQLFSHLYQHFPHRFPHTAQTLSAAAGKPDILQMQTRS